MVAYFYTTAKRLVPLRTGDCPSIAPRIGEIPPSRPWNPRKPESMPNPYIPMVPLPAPAPGREQVDIRPAPTEIVPCQACKGTGKRREDRKTVVCTGCQGSGVHRV